MAHKNAVNMTEVPSVKERVDYGPLTDSWTVRRFTLAHPRKKTARATHTAPIANFSRVAIIFFSPSLILRGEPRSSAPPSSITRRQAGTGHDWRRGAGRWEHDKG